MRALAVLAERLAVVGDDDDGGAGEEAGLLEMFEQASDGGVGVGDLAVVRRISVRGGKRRRRRVGRVRIEQVQPREERL